MVPSVVGKSNSLSLIVWSSLGLQSYYFLHNREDHTQRQTNAYIWAQTTPDLLNWLCCILSFHPLPSAYPVLSVTRDLNSQCNLYLGFSVNTVYVEGYMIAFTISNFTQLENCLIRIAQFSSGVILRSSVICCSVNMVLCSEKKLGPFWIPYNGILFFEISWLEMATHAYFLCTVTLSYLRYARRVVGMYYMKQKCPSGKRR